MKKKETIPEPHFKILVDVYFKFCEKKFNAKPSFDGSIPRDFKNLIVALRKRTEDSKFEWTEDCAKETLSIFLEAAISDRWLSENFLIRTLFTQKDKIFFKLASHGNKSITPNGSSKLGTSDSRMAALSKW